MSTTRPGAAYQCGPRVQHRLISRCVQHRLIKGAAALIKRCTAPRSKHHHVPHIQPMKIMEHFTAAGASKCRLFLSFIIMIIMNTLPELNNDAFNSIEYVCLRRKLEGIERCLGIQLP